MRTLIAFFALAIVANLCNAQWFPQNQAPIRLLHSAEHSDSVEKFSQIKIFVPDKISLDRIWSAGIDYEGVAGKMGGWMEFVAGKHELQQLQSIGVPYEMVTEDLAAYYASRLAGEPVNALGFGYGSMGGFYTYTEVLSQLDSMLLLYPSLITMKDSIGSSIENRALWAVKISDDPSTDDPGEPEVLYTALHHAREAEGMMAVLYYMWWLLDNYGINPEATYLVNNRQMWFIPVVNPDGYAYNQRTNPTGGGMWRKNRRDNGGSFGVDLNRNYGPYYMWDAPNGGSSTDPSSDTYRGTAPFSEPETQSIDNFMRAHDIKICLNYHTYGNYLIYPWGYLSMENGDSLIYRDWAYDMTAGNHYENGTNLQTLGYQLRGNAEDYMFGDTTKPTTYAVLVEVGRTGFWPSTGEIFPLAIENLNPNRLLSYFAGHYPTLRRYDIDDPGGDNFIDPGEDFTLSAWIRNRGLTAASNLSVTVSANTVNVQFPSPTILLANVPSQSEVQVSFSGSVPTSAPAGTPLEIYLTYTDGDGFNKNDTVKAFIGTPAVVFVDSANFGTGNWTTGQGWGITASAHTPPFAFTDSPAGSYSVNANNSLTLVGQVNLVGYQYSWLRFWTKWAIEPTWDFATVEVSTNGGSTWMTQRTQMSHSGSGRGRQPVGSWGYESYTPGLTWVEQEADLSPYVGGEIKIRFRVATDVSDQRDGFYVDDIRVYGYRAMQSIAVNMNAGWNILSVPLVMSDYSKSALFPSATTSAFRYQPGTGYVSDSLLANGLGYWLRFPAAETRPMTGVAIDADTFSVQSAWNLIGSISTPVPVASIGSIPGGIVTSPFYTYGITGYEAASSITPGKGYWVKVTQPGSLVLSSIPSPMEKIRIIATGEMPPAPPGEVTAESSVEKPREFALVQNYPNPFNPGTTIRYELPRTSHVCLSVYDVLGREIATLANEAKEPGTYTTQWDASSVSSGVYLYRLTAGNFVQTRKMVVVR